MENSTYKHLTLKKPQQIQEFSVTEEHMEYSFFVTIFESMKNKQRQVFVYRVKNEVKTLIADIILIREKSNLDLNQFHITKKGDLRFNQTKGRYVIIDHRFGYMKYPTRGLKNSEWERTGKAASKKAAEKLKKEAKVVKIAGVA